MAPSRGKGKAAAKSTAEGSTRPTRKSTRNQKSANDGIDDVYQSMLAEAETDSPIDQDRPLKKRRIAEPTDHTHPQSQSDSRTARSKANPRTGPQASLEPGLTLSRQQTVEDSSDSDESDFEFEDVDLDTGIDPQDGSVDGIEDLSISVQSGSGSKRAVQSRGKPATNVEKAHRLLVHKLHVLCLLGHCMFVNGRCNNDAAKRHLRAILTSKTVSYLTPRKDHTQFQRNRSFLDGLQQAVNAFTAEYRVTGSGIMRPRWAIDEEPQARDTGSGPIHVSDFIEAAQNLEGSQDLGNQLFCALLRSVGVQARVVCSLQPLPFSSVPKAPTPKKSVKPRIYATDPETTPTKPDIDLEDPALGSSNSIGKVPSIRRRLGRPTFAGEPSKIVTPKKAKHVPKLSYPVFWVEAFNEAHQKWVAVDPLVTNTIGKPSKLEPPSSYDLGQLIYIIALEIDGVVRDVTRRYAKAYNAKTRRHRVESSPDGARWWKKVMRVFRRRGGRLDRDQVEDSELAQKEAREGMPANVLDFKDHPYYALGRHLKRHEVIHPLREVGKVNAGTAAKPRMESVYRRQDLQVCRSADKWYRLGREIKEGEQPLKHVPVRINRQRSLEPELGGDASAAPTTALYGPFQTQLYVPPPVDRGRLPKNIYGNLDIYVPSMVPAGGVHVRHHLAQRAARSLRVDYADAVTGFKFQGRHGTAIIEGVVVAQQYAEAVQAVVTGIEEEIIEEESKARSLIALKQWKHFLTGLRIADRVNTAYGEADPAHLTITEEDKTDQEEPSFGSMVNLDPLPTAGRFSLIELSIPSKLAKQRKRKAKDSESEDEIDESLEHESFDGDDDAEFAGGFFPDPDAEYREGNYQPNRNSQNEDIDIDGDGGGFIVEDIPEEDDSGGGGFVVEGNETDEVQSGSMPKANDDDGLGGGFIHDADDGNNDDLFEEQEDAFNVPPGSIPDKSVPSEPRGDKKMNEQTQKTIENEHEAEAPDTMDIDSPPVPTPVHQPFENTATTQQAEKSKAPSDNESDKGSLSSHDPEDDGAEPDWLESD